MHAIQSSRPSLRPVQPATPRRSVRTRHRRQHAEHTVVVAGASVKLATNLILIAVAGAALVRLLPQTFAQQTKLNELKTEVAWVEGRVDRLHGEFTQHFDPQQTQTVMKQQSNRVDPRQRQVIWLSPNQAQHSGSTTQP